VKLARDQFVSTHRPKIRVKHLWLISDVWHNEQVVVDLFCVNSGPAIARLHEIGLKCLVIDVNKNVPAGTTINALIKPYEGWIKSGFNYTFAGMTDGTVISSNQNMGIQQGLARLICFGYVSYFDTADRLRITGFCRELTFPATISANRSISSCRFRVFDDPDFEDED
ncbi:MAG: hypothetical protein WAL59_27485, partial [Roseiarcus sp.]